MNQTESFSLKDQLFNAFKVQALAKRIQAVYPQFKSKDFCQSVLGQFPQLELKARIDWISECLRPYLPLDYQQAVEILLASLPTECDPALNDDDFGDFIYAPYSKFVADYGCTEADLLFSLEAIRQITTRFSAEYAIRFFINVFPEQTYQTFALWQHDSHYHVRRLVSEGSRPKLPWAQKITSDPQRILPLLDHLHTDPTRFVTRSVANHLNDLAKIEPDWVLERLQNWSKLGQQDPKELAFISRHALRSLVKQGHAETLLFLGYTAQPQLELSSFNLLTSQVQIGQSLQFEFELNSLSDVTQQLVIDYQIHFRNKKGSLNPKVFKLKSLTLSAKQAVKLTKKHPLKIMTTKALYPGQHVLVLQINGQNFGQQQFQLIA